MNIINIPCRRENFGGLRSSKAKYLVVHFTSNDGDTARNNGEYFARELVGASAHYFVDEREIVCSVDPGYIAWHCGGEVCIHPKCRNSNSIGVELCSRVDKDGMYYFTEETMDKAAELIRWLMKKDDIPIENVIRHYDVTGKNCPAPFVGAGQADWEKFKEVIAMNRYNTIEEMPEWAKPTIQKLVDAKILNGTGEGLDLSMDSIRLLVIFDRAGVFDR
jgi:N-acetylmuramoyl-L-alanine amidase